MTGFAPYDTASTLQQILANKRMEARQSMLDQLNRQNVQSEMDWRRTQGQELQSRIQGLNTEREAIGNRNKAQTEEIQRRAAALANYQPPDDMPASIKQQIGLAKAAGDYDALRTILTNWGALEKPNPKAANIRQLIGNDVDKTVIDRATGQPPVGPLTEDEIRNTHWISRSQEAAPQHPLIPGEMPSPDDPTKNIPAWLNPWNPAAPAIPISGGAHKPVRLPIVKPVPEYDKGLYERYTAAMKNNIPGSEGLLHAWAGSISDPNLRTDVTQMIAADKAAKIAGTKILTTDALRAQGRLTPPDDIAGDPVKSAAYIDKLMQYLKMSRGGF